VDGATGLAGIRSPASEWDFAEGSTLPGFQEYLSIQNPSGVDAPVTITYGFEGAGGRTTSLTVPAHQRRTVDVNSASQAGPGQTGVSARVVSSGSTILAERPFYFRRDIAGSGLPNKGAHVAQGALAATEWFFAEGNVLPGWAEFLSIYNPGLADAIATVEYLLESAPSQTRMYTVASGTRRTVQVFSDSIGQGVGRGATDAPSKGVSMRVTSTRGIVAERPMYAQAIVGGGFVNDGHDVVGATSRQGCVSFAVARTTSPDSTFLTLANPGSAPVHVFIDLYTNGARPLLRYAVIDSRSRLTIDLSSSIANAVFGVDVVGQTSADTFVAEEPSYFMVAGALDLGAISLVGVPC
jgi:hypothetical protein